MPTQIYLVNNPSNTQKTLVGTGANDDYIKLDRSAVTSTFSAVVLSGIHFNADGSPVLLISDILFKTNSALTLPTLDAANAIENIALVGGPTQVLDGLYKIAKSGDYSLSAEPYLMIGANDAASTLIGQNSTNSVANIAGGSGNDQITGSAGSSVLYGMEGTNTLISRGTGFDYIRGFASMKANDTIRVESTQGIHMLQIYMSDPSPQQVYLEKIGNDLVGKITNSAGDSYTFKVVDQYAGKPLTNLNIYAAPTSSTSITASTTGIYIGGDLTDAKITPTARAMAIGDSASNVFDYRL
jgi:Ca2+-binding RTX toxin-like protein